MAGSKLYQPGFPSVSFSAEKKRGFEEKTFSLPPPLFFLSIGQSSYLTD
jgi:hypothetical protein